MVPPAFFPPSPAQGTEETGTVIRTPTKKRSFSDPPNGPSALQPSPDFRERARHHSKDDNAVPTTPRSSSSTLRRPDSLVRGLSLQMPGRGSLSEGRSGPLSPLLDQHNIYIQAQNQQHSPATSLPRHSRGLDFSRACTNLHHSTVAEQATPDSSPVLTVKGMAVPSRKMSISSMALDSPALGIGSVWGSLNPEKSTVSSSVGSVNMMGSDSESSSSDEDMASIAGDDVEDGIFSTPQVHKLQNPTALTPFAPRETAAPWAAGLANPAYSPAAASLMKSLGRRRLHKNTNRRSRKSSSSASNSGYSSMASPRTTSPPPLRSIESATGTGGYFAWAHGRGSQSRRQSLALGTDGLHLSSGNDSGDEASHPPSTPGVVRRPVTRRGNLLPKTKGFTRIKALLAEEATPVDTDLQREAETIRQVRERDSSVPEYSLEPDRPGTITSQSSPSLLPAVPEAAQEDFGKDLDLDNTPNPFKPNGNGLGVRFGGRNHSVGGTDFWSRFDNRVDLRTPPPPTFPRHSNSAISDINMDSPATDAGSGSQFPPPRLRAASSASETTTFGDNPPPNPNGNGVNDDVHIKKFKRRREDDFDIATIKRRAVSPGMSVQNSPILAQSPSNSAGQHRDSLSWGQPPEKKATGNGGSKDSNGGVNGSSDASERPSGSLLTQIRSGSQGSNVSSASQNVGSTGLVTQGRKLGLQGMMDTNDGLMKMSIE